MTLDPVLLSRLQWAWVIAWHILLPAFTVADRQWERRQPVERGAGFF